METLARLRAGWAQVDAWYSRTWLGRRPKWQQTLIPFVVTFVVVGLLRVVL